MEINYYCPLCKGRLNENMKCIKCQSEFTLRKNNILTKENGNGTFSFFVTKR